MNMCSSQLSTEAMPLPKSAGGRQALQALTAPRRRPAARAGETRRWPDPARGTALDEPDLHRVRWRTSAARWRQIALRGGLGAGERGRSTRSRRQPRRPPSAAPARARPRSPRGIGSSRRAAARGDRGGSPRRATPSGPRGPGANELVGDARRAHLRRWRRPARTRASAAPPARRRAGRRASHGPRASSRGQEPIAISDKHGLRSHRSRT